VLLWFFCLPRTVKRQPIKRIPVLIALGAILLIGLMRWLQVGFFESLERMTYDMRARQALRFAPTVATNLGFVFIDDASIAFVATNQSLSWNAYVYWPRHVYGRVVEELAAQGARAVALDVIFDGLRPRDNPVRMGNNTDMESDRFFAVQMRRAGNVILAMPQGLTPPLWFRTNAFALGDITTHKDPPEGVLRRAQAFRVITNWHFAFRQVAADPDLGLDLDRARVEGGQVVLPRLSGDDIKVPLDREGNFDLADFGGENLPPGVARKAKPFTEARLWHMGVVLAAEGYPGEPRKGDPIAGLEGPLDEGVQVFHAGTAFQDGQVVTNGGRVLGVTALGASLLAAQAAAYAAVETIHFEGAHFRHDIAAKAVCNCE